MALLKLFYTAIEYNTKYLFFLFTCLVAKVGFTRPDTGFYVGKSSATDTLRFRNLDGSRDTFFRIVTRMEGGFIEQKRCYGNQVESSSCVGDTFVTGKRKWQKVYNGNVVPFLSVKGFKAGDTVLEFFDYENKERFYYAYVPLKLIRAGKKKFYLYEVMAMSGKGMDESLGDGGRVVVFDFSTGIVYKRSFLEKKVLVGYEKYVPYFTW